MPKHPTHRARLTARFASLGALALSAGSALAQNGDLRPPTPGDLAGAPTVLTIIATVLLAGLVMLAAFFPSKRGHQD